MSTSREEPGPERAGAVFISYAREDSAAADRLALALRAAGIEVWLDRSELRGGDAWDAAIRQQIRSCALFIAIVSAHTQRRDEGYFRLEWKLAVDRSWLIAADRPFLVPVVVDGLAEAEARVPDRFREVQWTHLPSGDAPAEFVDRVRGLLARGLRAARADAGIPRPAETRDPPRSAPARGRRARVLAALAVVVAGGAAVVAFRHPGPPDTDAAVADDRRMTFAMLPVGAGAPAARSAALRDAIQRSLDANGLWVRAATPGEVDRVAARGAGLRASAAALRVHFLLRILPARGGDAGHVDLQMIDGASERVLGTIALALPPGAAVPSVRDVDEATGRLVYSGLLEEVRRASRTPEERLDARDAVFRAFVEWNRVESGGDPRTAYATASRLLERALSLAPDDKLALMLTAQINFCECLRAWADDLPAKHARALQAMDRYLAGEPNDATILLMKASLFNTDGKPAEALVLAESLAGREAVRDDAQVEQATALALLGRAREAVPIVDGLARRDEPDPGTSALAAAVHFLVGEDTEAARQARIAVARAPASALAGRFGAVRLTLAAAEQRLGHAQAARDALQEFRSAVPAVGSVTQLRRWLSMRNVLARHEPFYDALRRAGLPD
jgi:tetratricopeptide (TPR) repeat protein